MRVVYTNSADHTHDSDYTDNADYTNYTDNTNDAYRTDDAGDISRQTAVRRAFPAALFRAAVLR